MGNPGLSKKDRGTVAAPPPLPNAQVYQALAGASVTR